ncbi:hypothetical protein BOX15_Mlig031296g1, partial [Macrostomum lignano]
SLDKSAVLSSNRMLCSENLLLLALVSSCCCLQSLSAKRFGPQPASFRALSRPAQSGVSSALRSQLGQLASPLPGGVVCPTCLLVAPRANSRLVQGSVARQELQQAIRSRGLPQEVANRLAALAFARSVSFHTFSFTVSALVGRGHYETFVGAGRRLDDVSVEFGIVHSVATAQLVAKTTPVPMRSCKRRWFIRRCRSWTQQVPRGLTAEELRQVEAGLRHFAIAAAASRVAASSGLLRSRRSAEEVASDAPEAPEVVEELQLGVSTTAGPTAATSEDGGNATLVELVRTGFDRLAISATSQTLRRIPVSMATAFASVFTRSLGLPKSLAGPLRVAVIEAAVTATADGALKQISALFNSEDDPAAIRFIQLGLVRRQSSFDLTSATVRLEARFADRLQLLVSQEGDDEEVIRIRRLPAQVSHHDVRQALRLLQAAAEGRLSGKLLPAETALLGKK